MEGMIKLAILLFLVLTLGTRGCYTDVSVIGTSCNIPEGPRGTCVPLEFCPPIFSMMIQSPKTDAVAEYLRMSMCSTGTKEIIVCCFKKYVVPGYDALQSRVDEIQEGSSMEIHGGEGVFPATKESIFYHRHLNLLPRATCGMDLSNRITGGTIAQLKEYPWLALLDYQTKSGRRFLCGGALINNRYVLTAAHCIVDIGSLILVGVRLGEHDITTDPDCTTDGFECSARVQDFGVDVMIPHPGFDPKSANKYHDIALLRLSEPVSFSDSIQPICLPEGDSLYTNYTGKSLIVAGWGKTENGVNSNVKLFVNVPMLNQSTCAPIYKKNFNLSDYQMCAGGLPGKDSCKGDSGGPLMSVENAVELRSGKQFVVAGVVSIGPAKCGIQGKPGIYTRVGPYVNWILDQIKP